MKKTIVSFLLLISIVSSAQIREGFSNPSKWMILDDTETQFSWAGGRLLHNSTYSGMDHKAANSRAIYNLNGFLMKDKDFKIDMDFEQTISTTPNANSTILAITKNTHQSFVTRTSMSTFSCEPNSSITVMAGVSDDKYHLSLQLKELNTTTTGIAGCSNSITYVLYPNLTKSGKKYLRLYRRNNAYRLSLYSTSSRDTSVFDTIICSNISVTDSLNYVQVGMHSTLGPDVTIYTAFDSFSLDSAYKDTLLNRKCSGVITNGLMDVNSYKIEIYPTIVSDKIFITLGDLYTKERNVEIELIGLYGKIIKNFKIKGSNYNNHIEIDASHIDNGIYFLRVRSDQDMHRTTKIQILH